MVKALHRAGLEVILDVVYNHTAEGNENGPTLSFRGLDNGMYYRLAPGDASRYYDTTGTGNSLNAGNPYALRLIMDSLRYWVSEMHVDGFRFDLAATLGREGDNRFDQLSAFFELVAQDPVIGQAKLIAEPWDVGQADSYDLGQFPAQWREWNGRYRDSMRDFWRSKDVGVAEFATRFSGSSDLYGAARRRPTASVNLITVHDGFTLRDLVSYDDKHNEANGEDNRDGTDDNRSWNCGAEGPTDDPDVNALRARQSRAMLSTLLLSFGLPLLLGGDEIGRTQGGNNNAYCQDNEISWFDWAQADADLRGYVKRLLALRREHPVFRRKRFLTGARRRSSAGSRRGHADEPASSGPTRPCTRSRSTWTAPTRPTRRTTARRCSTTTSSSWSTPTGSRSRSPSRRSARHRRPGSWNWTATTPPSPLAGVSQAHRRSAMPAPAR